MGQQDVDRALAALGDDAVKAQIADGDLSAFEGLELSDDERQLVIDAAGDLPEVAGFAFGNLFGYSTGQKIDIDVTLKDAGKPLGRPGTQGYITKTEF